MLLSVKNEFHVQGKRTSLLCVLFIFRRVVDDFESRKSDLWKGSQIKAFICERSLIFASNSPIFMFQNRGCYSKEIKNAD